MFRKILVLIFIFSAVISAQVQDSSSQWIKIISDSVSSKQDSPSISDSLITSVQLDSIAPIYANTFTENSFIIKNSELLQLEYQYTGDYLRLFPLNFIKDLGFTGQPNETFIYGVGNNSISFLHDGVSYNDRFSNSFNLNLIQSEDVDSIEMIPLPRGFLYSAFSNPIAVNFITKDFIKSQPYTRIRFYQGANRDMMFDGSFNAVVMNKLIASFDITNRIYDGTYDNSDYSIWQGKFKLKYLLSNDINIIATYNYNDYNAGYSGGVAVDSIIANGGIVDNVLYDFRAAPMFFPSGKLKTLTHLPRLRFLIKPAEWMKTDASLFFLFNRYEKNTTISERSENKNYGINIRNDFDYNILKFQLYGDYETQAISPNSLYHYTNNIFSISGIFSASLYDSTFIPSIYYKSSINKINSSLTIEDVADYKKNKNGFGFDILFKLKSNLAFYFGSTFLDGKTSTSDHQILMELGAKYNSEILKFDIKYFINEYEEEFYNGGVFFNTYRFGSLKGVGAKLSFNYSKLILESNSSYYVSNKSDLIGVPSFQTQTGLYFKDILFNNNLDLKTGFAFYYTASNNVYSYENGLLEVPSSNKLDFTLTAEIQKTAIVYFLWQNLLANDYYITPYYPMPGRSIRFGVAWEMFN